MWSLGCIFAELLGSKPLFKGRDCKWYSVLCGCHAYCVVVVDQLNQILYILGTPDDDTLNRIGSERVKEKKKAQIHGSNTHLTHIEIGTNLHQKSGEVCKDTTWTTISKCNRDSAWSARKTAYIWSNVSHWSRRCSESSVFRVISWSRRWGIHAANLSNDMCLLTCCLSQLILQQLISHSSR